MRRLACLTLAATLIAGPCLAQRIPQAPASRIVRATQDPSTASAGVYVLDSRQVSVILRVLHGGGFSYTVARMSDVSGVLSWDPDRIDRSKVSVKIATKSLQTNVPGFSDQLIGPDFLSVAKFPDATFRSTAVRRTGPTTGQITGDFTLHGVTQPLTLDVDLVGAGPALRGSSLGFHGRGVFRRSDFGVGPISSVIGDEVEVLIDVEFSKGASPEDAGPPRLGK